MNRTHSDLKPCPFCGGEAGVMTVYDMPPDVLVVCCTKCGARGPECTKEGYAITDSQTTLSAWNRRAGEEAPNVRA